MPSRFRSLFCLALLTVGMLPSLVLFTDTEAPSEASLRGELLCLNIAPHSISVKIVNGPAMPQMSPWFDFYFSNFGSGSGNLQRVDSMNVSMAVSVLERGCIRVARQMYSQPFACGEMEAVLCLEHLRHSGNPMVLKKKYWLGRQSWV
jgi:hypothetical protein